MHNIKSIVHILEAGRMLGEEQPILFLGSRTGWFYNNSIFYSILKNLMAHSDFNSLPEDFDSLTKTEKFQACYKLLQSKRYSERDIFTFLIAAIPRRGKAARTADQQIAELILDGYFSTVISTSIDPFLETALLMQRDGHDIPREKRPHDFKIAIQGYNTTEDICQVERRDTIKVIKIFGDLETRHYNTVGNELQIGTKENGSLKLYLEELLSKRVIIVGYDPLWDHSLDKVFLENGKSLFYVNENTVSSTPTIPHVFKKRSRIFLEGNSYSYEFFAGNLHGETYLVKPFDFKKVQPELAQEKVQPELAQEKVQPELVLVEKSSLRTVEQIADFIFRNKDIHHPIVLILGTKTSGLYGNSKLYESVSSRSSQREIFNNISSAQKFRKSYYVLRDEHTARETEMLLKSSMNGLPRWRDEDIHLAKLIREGYFDIVITTSIDTFLQNALAHEQDAKYFNYSLVIYRRESIDMIIRQYKEGTKIIQLFGSLNLSYFNTPKNEIQLESSENKELRNFLEEVLQKDILVIGYDPIWDAPVAENIIGNKGSIFYVNEEMIEEGTRFARIMWRREGLYHIGPQSSYKRFMKALYEKIQEYEKNND